jgi:hypothetical protein
MNRLRHLDHHNTVLNQSDLGTTTQSVCPDDNNYQILSELMVTCDESMTGGKNAFSKAINHV